MNTRFNFKSLIVSFFLLGVFFGAISPQTALAITITLSGRISDSSGIGIASATINVIDATTNFTVASSISNSSGNYAVGLNQGSYNVQVIPPEGSGLSQAVAINQILNSDKTLNFVLVQSGSVVFNGRVLTSSGVGVPNVQVQLSNSIGTGGNTLTDGTGNYSLLVQPDDYTLQLRSTSDNRALGLPYEFYISTLYSINQSTQVDIVLPVRQLNVHVQDSSGNSLQNIHLNTNSPPTQFTIPGLGSVSGYSDSFDNTNTSGNSILWLFPTSGTSSANLYTITASPLDTSLPFSTTLISNVNLTDSSSLIITMNSAYRVTGRISNREGIGIPQAQVQLFRTQGGGGNTQTDSLGNYSLQVSPGTYEFQLSSTSDNRNLNIPVEYSIYASLSVNQNTTLDVILPVKKVDVYVKNSLGNPLANVQVGSTNPQTTLLLNQLTEATGRSDSFGITDSSGKVTLWLFPTSNINKYSLTAYSLDSNSIYSSTTVDGIEVLGDTSANLIMNSSILVEGRITNREGVGLPDVAVQLSGQGGGVTQTDSQGHYSMRVSLGQYEFIVISSRTDSRNLNLPYEFYLNSPLNIDHNIAVDVLVPVKKISVHIQDIYGNPIENVRINTSSPLMTVSVYGLPRAVGYSNTFGNTDSSGNVTLWLLPTDSTHAYTFFINPPSGSNYAPFNLENVQFSEDEEEIISLQPLNEKPIISPIPDTAINEGDLYSRTASFQDPSSVSWTATVDYGDGSGEQPLTLSGTNFSLSHTYQDNGVYTVTVNITDNQGSTGTVTATVTVSNVNPAVGVISAPADPQLLNTTISTSTSFSDPGALDTHTAVWTWNDGSTSPGVVDETNGTVSGSHTYTMAGVYEVKVTVTDDDLGVGESVYQFVVVYDSSASGGFVTGAGTIDSPIGAYTTTPEFTGVARFGFISKYQPGASVPTGDTQFRFQTAQFTFSSFNYQWLVVAGAQAKFKGTGTVNGQGNYGFQLSGTDGVINGGGGADKFRIKIWDINNNDTLVYDNQLGAADNVDPTTTITGGNIVIH